MNLICQFCGGSDGHSEEVHTRDLEAKNGWEIWFCCHPCRDSGEACETFHRIPKDDDALEASPHALDDDKKRGA